MDVVENGQRKEVYYNSSYGAGCQAWDLAEQPYCIDPETGLPPSELPSWCEQKWCWVADSCSLPIVPTSSYWPDSSAKFSYQTCGETNTFNSWFNDASNTHTVDEIVEVRQVDQVTQVAWARHCVVVM